MSPHTLYSYSFDTSESALQHTHSIDHESGLPHSLLTTSLFSPIPLLLLWFMLLLPFAEIVLIPPKWCFCDWTFLPYLSFTISRHIFVNTHVIMSLLTNPSKWSPPMTYTRICLCFLLLLLLLLKFRFLGPTLPRPTESREGTLQWESNRYLQVS